MKCARWDKVNPQRARENLVRAGLTSWPWLTMLDWLASSGVGEVLGNAGKFRLGFSPEYGFIGIAVALLGRNQPVGVVAAALLFGALHKGAADLDLETEHVTRELSLVLQALIILSVSADGLWSWMKRRGEA